MKTEIKDRITEPASQEGRKEVWHASNLRPVDVLLSVGVACLLMVSALIWSSFDYRFPTQDEAAHIMNSIKLSELIAHCRPWQYQWWYQCYSVSYFYPPVTYVVGGCSILAFGQSLLVKHGYMAFFSGLMAASIYGLTRLIGGGRLAACSAVLFLSAYPIISWLSHTFFLDMPAVAMTAFALMALTWWRKSQRPNGVRTALCGLAFGAACLTKQMVVGYLIPPVLYLLVKYSLGKFRAKQSSADAGDRVWLAHTLCIAAVATLVSLPFVIASHEFLRAWLNTNVQTFAKAGVHHSFIGNLSYFLSMLASEMSPVLLCVFAIAIILLRRIDYGRLAPVLISTMGGLGFTCTCMGTDLEERYLVPFLIAPAILSGFLVEKLVSSGKWWKQVLGATLVILALMKYFNYNFSPHPIGLPKLTWPFALSEHDGNPSRYADWGYPFILATIQSVDGSKPVYLNVVPNHDVLHANALSLFFREQRVYTILPTTPRVWTIVGDRVRFDPTSAGYPMWYLIKSGDNGFRLCDQQSRDDYEKLIAFVRNGNKYRLVASKVLPDRSELMLYRRTF